MRSDIRSELARTGITVAGIAGVVGALVFGGRVLSTVERPNHTNTSRLSLLIKDVSTTSSNAKSPNILGPVVQVSHDQAVKIYDDIEALKTPLPTGHVDCGSFSGSEDELKFSNPDSTVFYDPSGCFGVNYAGKLLVPSQPLARDITNVLPSIGGL